MNQPRLWSAIEATTQMCIGLMIAVIFYMLIWPLFGHDVSVAASSSVAIMMFPVNFTRQYLVRRIFNSLHRRTRSPTADSGAS